MCNTPSHCKQLVCIFQSILYTQNRTRTYCLTVCVVISHHKQFIQVVCLPRITHILFTRLVCVLLAHRKYFIHVNCLPQITHILLSWTISVLLAQHKQFIRVNYMSYIAHAFIWLLVSVVPPHSSERIVCSTSHTPLSGSLFLLFLITANS